MARPKRHTRPTVEDATTQYAEALQRRQNAGRVSATTVKNYTCDLKDFVRLAGPTTVLDDLEADDLEDIFAQYAKEPDRRYKDATRAGRTRGIGAQSRFARSLSAFFTHAERQAWIQLNPVPDCQAVPKAPKTTSAARAGIPLDQALELLNTPAATPGKRPHPAQLLIETRDAFILRLLLETGLRVSDLCTANRSSLSERGGEMWLTVTSKRRKTRSVPLSAATVAAYELYDTEGRVPPRASDPQPIQEDAERALVTGRFGRRIQPRDIQRMVDRHCKHMSARLRVDITPHALRHTAATLLLASGAATVKEVQVILGHESLATTGLYLEAFPDNLARAVAAGPLAAA